MATKTASGKAERAARITVSEVLTGPVAGALIGYGVFAVLLTVIGALFADGKLSIPEENWKDLGLGASVLAGLLLFILAVAFGAAIVARAADQPQYRRRLARRDARLRPPARHRSSTKSAAAPKGRAMGIGVSIVLLAAGAILTWAVTADVSGVDLSTIGVILMIVGIVGLIWALAVSSAMPWRRDRVADERHIHHA